LLTAVGLSLWRWRGASWWLWGSWAIVSLPVLLFGFARGRWVISRLFGGYLDEPGADAKSGVGEITSLMALDLTGVVALIAYVQGKPDPDTKLIWAYFLLSLVPIASIVLMLHLRQERRHVFDRGTRIFGVWIAVFLGVVVYLATWACSAGFLPGQRVRSVELRSGSPKDYVFKRPDPEKKIKKGDGGILLEYGMCPANLGIKELDGSLVVHIELSRNLRGSWQIADVNGFRLQTQKGETPEVVAVPPTYHVAPAAIVAYWHNIDPYGSYLLVVKLHPLKDTAKPEELLSRIRDGHEKALTVTTHYLDEP